MSQNFEMKINPLPAKTWNWLHMNGTVLKEEIITERGTVKADRPETVTETECRMENLIKPETQVKSETQIETAEDCAQKKRNLSQIKTGMGTEMDAFADAGSLEWQVFTSKSGKKESQPLRLTFSYQDKSRTMNRIGIHMLPDSELTVVMDFTSEKETEGTAAIQTKIYAEENAVLHLIQVQRLGSKMTFLDDFGADCEKNARMETIQLVLGGKDTYLGNRTALRGESSDLESDIGYLLGGESRLDMNLEAVHTGKKTNSRMDAAGVLSGKAVKIFRGTIDFQKGCAGSVGNEKEDVLLLDDTIVNQTIPLIHSNEPDGCCRCAQWKGSQDIQTIPLILCNEEDVEGNHGATIGKLDEELLLYLESRGISEEAVYAMMAQARIDSICHKISDEEMKKKVQEYLEGEREE